MTGPTKVNESRDARDDVCSAVDGRTSCNNYQQECEEVRIRKITLRFTGMYLRGMKEGTRTAAIVRRANLAYSTGPSAESAGDLSSVARGYTSRYKYTLQTNARIVDAWA